MTILRQSGAILKLELVKHTLSIHTKNATIKANIKLFLLLFKNSQAYLDRQGIVSIIS